MTALLFTKRLLFHLPQFAMYFCVLRSRASYLVKVTNGRSLKGTNQSWNSRPAMKQIGSLGYINPRQPQKKKVIESQLGRVKGFIEVPEKKKEIADLLAETLIGNKDMKIVIAKCEELIQSGVLPEQEKLNII